MSSSPYHVAPDHPAFDGHFPGRPILPGAALLAALTEALRADGAIGDTPVLGAVKFTAPCGPGAHLRFDWQVLPRRVAFSATRLDGDAETIAASGHFEIDHA